jgi:hypothetical protein
MPRGCADFLWLFDGQKLEKNDQVKHIMTQMASFLAVFVGLWTLNIYILQ